MGLLEWLDRPSKQERADEARRVTANAQARRPVFAGALDATCLEYGIGALCESAARRDGECKFGCIYQPAVKPAE